MAEKVHDCGGSNNTGMRKRWRSESLFPLFLYGNILDVMLHSRPEKGVARVVKNPTLSWVTCLALALVAQPTFPARTTSEVEIATGMSPGDSKYRTETTWESEESYGSKSLQPSDHEAIWAVNPEVPGDDLPPKGRSLFDKLFSVERDGRGIYDIPFPFTRLVQKLDGYLPATKTGRSSTKQVLIPLGRSLQRHAAAPDYFEFPRVVVGVDTEPDRPGLVLLKDRLFLGYQEKARIIEVISYNELAGRFEFQVVRDYGPGMTPKVFYARRTICRSCHQNGGPIFPEAAWDETNSNPKIATRLWDRQRSYYGISLNRMTDVPFAIDSATDRANLISVYQLLWRQGCGDEDPGSVDCRAAAFTAMLQYRLSGRSHFDDQSSRYRARLRSVSERNWQARWPGGLKIPNPDIPNRDPISTHARVSPHHDPLTLRPPLEIWSIHEPGSVDRTIKGLSDWITTQEIRKLDESLSDREQQFHRSRQVLIGNCELESKPLSDASYRMSFNCRPRFEGDDGGFGMEGRAYVGAEKIADGVIDSLYLIDGSIFPTLALSGEEVENDGGHATMRFRLQQRRTGLSARLPDGRALQEIVLRWPNVASTSTGGSTIPAQTSITAEAVMSVVDDFAPVHAAIAELAARADRNPFSPEPFDATRTMRALFAQLGTTTDLGICCEDGATMPAAIVDGEEIPSVANRAHTPSNGDGIQAFQRHCATCHRTAGPFPPNFLYGEVDRVAENMTQCAPRIWYRLRMWQLPEDQRPKTPMPPITMLHASTILVEQWRESEELAGLQRYVADLLSSRNEKEAPWRDELIHRDYETLPECMADSGLANPVLLETGKRE